MEEALHYQSLKTVVRGETEQQYTGQKEWVSRNKQVTGQGRCAHGEEQLDLTKKKKKKNVTSDVKAFSTEVVAYSGSEL